MCVGVSAASAALSVERLSFQSQNTKVLLFFFFDSSKRNKNTCDAVEKAITTIFLQL